MRAWQWLLIVLVIAGIGAAIYFLKPVNGPARDLTLIGDADHGAYMLRLADCVSCHTDSKNKGPMLAGGAALQTAFGTFYAPNITPHPTAGIGGWSLEQFSKALSDGEGPQGHLYPVFPYDAFTRMTDQDLVDLYAALQDVPPSDKVAPAHDVAFPFSVRLMLAGWKNLFFNPRRYEPDGSRSAQWNRGRYLATGPSHCVTCHSPRNIFGAIEGGKEFTGNPAGGPGGKTPSITRDALQHEGYDAEGLILALKTGSTPDFDILGGAMGEVIADGTSQWHDDDLNALVAYLLDNG